MPKICEITAICQRKNSQVNTWREEHLERREQTPTNAQPPMKGLASKKKLLHILCMSNQNNFLAQINNEFLFKKNGPGTLT